MGKIIHALCILSAAFFANGAAATSVVDFLKFNGVTYINLQRAGRELDDKDLAQEIAKVKFKLAWESDGLRIKPDPSYATNEGYAANLEPGTPIHAVKGYSPAFRVAARRNDRLILFHADTNPNARKGGDLLDLADKVQYIGINADEGDARKEIGAIKNPALLAKLVRGILDAPVNQKEKKPDHGQRYFVVIYFRDGTAISRSYWITSGELSRGIMLPPEFGAAVRAALEGPKSSP